ncbi:hypothetical protein [Photobacterium alginatilyticum]|uniref:Uncharacterized protein n=1 Tax=Photobacterium alginatilyticum TaxID=1775171 RepID=A0ABW9YHC0_9GAMM|nr:hypothetical protein [Photobacterium alginatilyticum]NBI52946.1 hypothetical protein [Photobacterium alginatilyticum]
METVQSVINWLLTAPFGVLITALGVVSLVNVLIYQLKLGIKQDGKLSSTVFILACSILIAFNISISQYDVLTTVINWMTGSGLGILLTALGLTILIKFLLGFLKPGVNFSDRLTVFFYLFSGVLGAYSFFRSEYDAVGWIMYMLGTADSLDLLLIATVGGMGVLLLGMLMASFLPRGFLKDMLTSDSWLGPVWLISILTVALVNMSYPGYLFEKYALAQVEKRPWMRAVNYSYVEEEWSLPMSWYRPVLHSVTMVMPVVREEAQELQLKEYILTRLTFNKDLPRIYAQAYCESGEVIYHHQTEGDKKLQTKGPMNQDELALYCDFDWSAKLSLFEAVKKPQIIERLNAS